MEPKRELVRNFLQSFVRRVRLLGHGTGGRTHTSIERVTPARSVQHATTSGRRMRIGHSLYIAMKNSA